MPAPVLPRLAVACDVAAGLGGIVWGGMLGYTAWRFGAAFWGGPTVALAAGSAAIAGSAALVLSGGIAARRGIRGDPAWLPIGLRRALLGAVLVVPCVVVAGVTFVVAPLSMALPDSEPPPPAEVAVILQALVAPGVLALPLAALNALAWLAARRARSAPEG